MHLVFPSDPLRPRLPDEAFRDQIEAFAARGYSASFFSVEALATGRPTVFPSIPRDSYCLYRGWMMTPAEYECMVAEIERAGGQAIVSPEQYEHAHYLPNWYPRISDLTAETRVFPATADLESELRGLDWPEYFVKDYVKSLKTSVGSRIRDPSEIGGLLAEMRKYRDQIEGGVCVRRVEEYIPGTEIRYFAVRGVVYSSAVEEPIPELARTCASRIQSPFFSIDIAQRSDGVLRVVEVGDGQVSDLVGWSPQRLAHIWHSR